MKKKKAFDCVEMKWSIQQKIAEESAGLTEEEARRRQLARIAKNPILSRFLKKARSRTDAPISET
jgi:hypothetical protein